MGKSLKSILLIGLVFFILAAFYLVIFVFNNREEGLILIEKESAFLSFEIVDNEVEYKCQLTIENKSDNVKNFYLYALCPEDVMSGLITSERLSSMKSGNSTEYSIDANSIKSFEVTFIGEYAGTPQKAHRSLPEILLEEIIENERIN